MNEQRLERAKSGGRKQSTSGQQVMEWIKRRGSLTNQTGSVGRSRRNSEKPLITYTNDIKDYQLLYIIGQGASANVHMGRYIKMDKLVAIKQIHIEKFERHHIDELRNEIQIMSICRHPNLLPIHKSFINQENLWIITPVQNGGSCLDLIRLKYPSGVDEISCATILKQVLQGLLYLHNNDLVHRDIKCANMLICKDTGLVQLSDFGVSKTLMDYGRKKNRSTFVGTPAFIAPEVMEEKEYDERADIWSLGITLIELATGKAPYAHFPPLKIILMTIKNPPPELMIDEMEQVYTKQAKQVVGLCLQKDPQKRALVTELNEHGFFKKAKQPLSLVTTLHLNSLPPLHERPVSTNRESINEEEQINWDFGDINLDRKVSSESKDSGYVSRKSSFSRKTSSGRRDSIDSQDTESSLKGRFTIETPTQSPNLSRSASIERVSRFQVQRPQSPLFQ